MIQDFTQYVSGDEFLNSNTDIKNAETDFDYNSFYRAYVINNKDPERLGRVQVQIPTKGTGYLWAYPGLFSGLGFQTGAFVLPPIGSIVFVTFEYSDEHRPIYFGGIPTKNNTRYINYGPDIYGGNDILASGNDIPTEYTGTQQIVYKSPTGNIIYIDDNDVNNAIIMRNAYGQQFKIARTYDSSTDTYSNYVEMKYDNDNYLRLKEGEFKWVSNGVDVPIGNLGNARTVLWDEPDE